MRPKKRIILIDAQEDRRGITRFVLETSGYFVLSAATIWQAGELGSEELLAGHMDTLLLAWFPASDDFLRDMAGTLAFPWLFIAPLLPQGIATRIWPSMADVLERVKVATARKRGPMRGMKRPPKVVEPALAEACA